MSKLIAFATREDAESFAAKVDTALGYPAIGDGVCQRVHVGGGRHVDHPACCTVKHAEPIEGVTGFAYPVEEKVRAIQAREVADVLATKTEINQEEFERKTASVVVADEPAPKEP